MRQPTRQAHYDAGEDQQRHSVTHAALGDLLAQPHDERAAGGQRQHRHQNKPDTRIDDEVATFLQANGDTKRLNGAEHNCQIAGPLGNLLASEFTFLLQLSQGLIHYRQQLQDDGRRDVGHDAQSENGQLAQLPATEQIHETQERAPVLLEELLQLVGIDAGRRDVPAKTIHGQQSQRKQNPLAQVDRKSTRLNSSHANISYAVFCLKKKNHNYENEPVRKAQKQMRGYR